MIKAPILVWLERWNIFLLMPILWNPSTGHPSAVLHGLGTDGLQPRSVKKG